MPNGFHGSQEDWERMEMPLLKLDARLSEFASMEHLSLTKNYHNWPERSLIAPQGNLRRLIQIYLEDEKELTLNLWICVSEDRGNERFWKTQFLRKSVLPTQIDENLSSLLADALEIARGWNSGDLEFATKIKRHP